MKFLLRSELFCLQCLTHSECCSGSCLSFSYKCVPVPPSASVGTTFVPVTVDTANRFGEDDGGASITQKTCARNGEYVSSTCQFFASFFPQGYPIERAVTTGTTCPQTGGPFSLVWSTSHTSINLAKAIKTTPKIAQPCAKPVVVIVLMVTGPPKEGKNWLFS